MDMLSYLLGKKSGGGKGALVPVVVEELPEIGEAGKLYLVPKQNEEENDIFDEYIYVNDEWEKIGSTGIELNSGIPVIEASNPNASKSVLENLFTKYPGKAIPVYVINNNNKSNLLYLLPQTYASQCNTASFYTKPLSQTNTPSNYYEPGVLVRYSYDSNGICTITSISSAGATVNSVLATNNTTAYTPTDNYNPATKKYVDDAVAGAGGTSDYTELTNKPSINGVTLSGNKTSEDLGISDGTTYGVYYYNNFDTNENKATLQEIYNKLSSGNTNFKVVGYRIDTLHITESVYYYKGGARLYVIIPEFSYNSNTGAQYGIVQLIYNSNNQTVTQEYQNASIVNFINANQTITGKKTFDTLPESSVTPTTDNQLTNKKYVDDLVGNINTVLATLTTPSNNGGN